MALRLPNLSCLATTHRARIVSRSQPLPQQSYIQCPLPKKPQENQPTYYPGEPGLSDRLKACVGYRSNNLVTWHQQLLPCACLLCQRRKSVFCYALARCNDLVSLGFSGIEEEEEVLGHGARSFGFLVFVWHCRKAFECTLRHACACRSVAMSAPISNGISMHSGL